MIIYQKPKITLTNEEKAFEKNQDLFMIKQNQIHNTFTHFFQSKK